MGQILYVNDTSHLEFFTQIWKKILRVNLYVFDSKYSLKNKSDPVVKMHSPAQDPI